MSLILIAVVLLFFFWVCCTAPPRRDKKPVPPEKKGVSPIQIGACGHVLRCISYDTFIFETAHGEQQKVCLTYLHKLIEDNISDERKLGILSSAKLTRMRILSMWFSANHHPEVAKNNDIIICPSQLPRTSPCAAAKHCLCPH